MITRLTRLDELPALQDIERAAGECFRSVGMAEIADDEPPTLTELTHYQRTGRSWVTADDGDRPVAYVLTEPVDGRVHIEQLSVHPDASRQGVGRAMIDHLAARAAAAGLHGMTLTTFADVPWNAPYYAHRCGFRVLPEAEVTPGLREIRRREAELGLDRWPRVCMLREL
ncbi:GNAT family N-acetyltransferase [Streptomyces zagrosensis]|uniref:GNAT superfamily N-acetyltransferase n=1 Tax=Streptomyces zagrosensis TaxID=1042984 RepID=A0A7W9UZE6_9ACTN|nr:GNAT family N-acetyltransferase [Streptomyces zagrosensis]MBB5936960.1 GNAT superfamily N-acetyltransferase [Streptomyces zagrosensis]